MSTLKIIKFFKSKRPFKKYGVLFEYKGKQYIRHFGDLRYQHFRDSTPLGLYKGVKWEHKDPLRRKLYYDRHGLEDNPLSAKYWSNKYLW